MAKQAQILQLTPPNELTFTGPFEEVVTATLTLQNPSNEKVGFKVKTTAPKQYCVRPNSGVIDPSGQQTVSVMLQPLDDAGKAERSKHKFMVQSMYITGDVVPDNLDTVMKNAPKGTLMDSKLKCVFIDEPGSNEQPANGEAEVQPVLLAATSTTEESPEAFFKSVVTAPQVTPDIEFTETPLPSSQPTAGSTPAHTGTSSNVEIAKMTSESNMLRERAKKLSDENLQLKSEQDRLKQRVLTAQSGGVRVPVKRVHGSEGGPGISPLAIGLILVALMLGFIIGVYLS